MFTVMGSGLWHLPGESVVRWTLPWDVISLTHRWTDIRISLGMLACVGYYWRDRSTEVRMLIGVERCELQITFHLGIDKQGLGIHQLRWAAFHPSIPLAWDSFVKVWCLVFSFNDSQDTEADSRSLNAWSGPSNCNLPFKVQHKGNVSNEWSLTVHHLSSQL